MRIVVPVVVEMTDEQVGWYAENYGLQRVNVRVPAKDVVADVREYVLSCVQESAAFGEIGQGDGARGADVSLR